MLQTIGTIAAALVCPLMMILMMKGMHGGHDEHSMHGTSRRKLNSTEEELADLKSQLATLQAQYERLSHQVKEQPQHSHQSEAQRKIHG